MIKIVDKLFSVLSRPWRAARFKREMKKAFPPDGTMVKRPPVVNVELRLDGICAKTPPTAAAAIDLTNSKFPKIADIELDLPNQRQT